MSTRTRSKTANMKQKTAPTRSLVMQSPIVLDSDEDDEPVVSWLPRNRRRNTNNRRRSRNINIQETVLVVSCDESDEETNNSRPSTSTTISHAQSESVAIINELSEVEDLLANNDVTVQDTVSIEECLESARRIMQATEDLLHMHESGNFNVPPENNMQLPDSTSTCSEVIDLCSVVSPVKEVEQPQINQTQSRNGIGDCPICLEPLGEKTLASTICGHIFCDPCIRACVTNTKRCPNCRKRLNLKQIHPLFI